MNNPDTVCDHGTSGEKPKFGPHPDFSSPNFDFEKELGRLPFPLNLGKVELSKLQQVRFLELIYDNKSVFSLGVMRIWVFVTVLNIPSLQLRINQFTCHIELYQFSFRLR